MRAAGRALPVPASPASPADMATICYTSGAQNGRKIVLSVQRKAGRVLVRCGKGRKSGGRKGRKSILPVGRVPEEYSSRDAAMVGSGDQAGLNEVFAGLLSL